MPNSKLILEHLLDIGGLATLNNFYSTGRIRFLISFKKGGVMLLDSSVSLKFSK